uniref:RNA polymerase, sigma-24 subunit, ECF subfamily n=1 Tax=Solibacter usitatus (strain Ellin6076) TaxID=234267 RepID=Q01UK6_SOLUE
MLATSSSATIMSQESSAAAAREKPASLVFLVEAMAQGQQNALGQLYDETSALLNGLLVRMLERPEDAEEVLLDVYMKAWKYAGGYSEARGSVQAWLVTMARNAAIDRIRQHRAQPKALVFAPENQAEPISSAASPEQQAFDRQRRRRVQHLLNQLPLEQRQTLMLAFFGGLTHAELAERLGEPLGTVKSRIRAGLIRMRGLLEEPAL